MQHACMHIYLPSLTYIQMYFQMYQKLGMIWVLNSGTWDGISEQSKTYGSPDPPSFAEHGETSSPGQLPALDAWQWGRVQWSPHE